MVVWPSLATLQYSGASSLGTKVVQTTLALRLFPLPLAAVATLWLAACQGSGTYKPVASLEGSKSVGGEIVSGEQAGVDPQVPLPTETGSGSQPSDGAGTVAVDSSAGTHTAANPSGSTGNEGAASNEAGSGVDSVNESSTSVVFGTTPGGERLALHPRNNPTAADLLDHWGHRRVQGIVTGLGLNTLVPDADATDLTVLQELAQDSDEAVVAPDLQDGDEIRVLGSNRGVTYGRWTGGPADTLSIEFELSIRDRTLRERPEIREILEPMLERAGKAWSYGIVDTWTTWELEEGDFKFWLINGTGLDTPVYVGEGGEVSTGLVIDVRDDDLPAYAAGWAQLGTSPPGELWQPRFAPLEIDTDHLQQYLHETRASAVFRTLTHEIGHVLGAWTGGDQTILHAPYTNTETGSWTGPNVVALHGGPAPFQDASDTHAWVEGERDPLATTYDFAHSGVCASLMAYCGQSAALASFLPHAIDFAFLADLGMTITEKTERPETYGLAGWTDYAGFTLAVSRDLRVELADPQPHYDGAANQWHTLDVTDLLQVDADAFGYLSSRNIRRSYPLAGSLGKVHYAGGLIGAAIDLAALPPVTGDANLTVDLDSLDGTADFTSLNVHSDEETMIFAGGALHYPFALSDNAIVGTDDSSTLSASFYGPEHEDIAGTLHDPRAGLLASFGATQDDRPDREQVIAAADYIAGRSYQTGTVNSAEDGWYRYRCGTDSACESRRSSNSNWSGASRENVLAATAGWDRRDSARLVEDRGSMRIERQTAASTDGRQGRHVVEGYTGTMEYGAFGAGFEKYTDWWNDPTATTSNFFNVWSGVQGEATNRLPDERARWSGLMLGYQYGHGARNNPFVEGRATVDYHLSTNLVDVEFSDIESRDGQRNLTDFGFDGLQPQADGTFTGGGTAGVLSGAFFGPAHEEAAGTFHHNAESVTGSFGALRMSDTVTLEEDGSVKVGFVGTDDAGTQHSIHEYGDWGLWGRQFQEDLFGAFVEKNFRRAGNSFSYWTPTTRVSGTRTGSNPVSGNAVWLGGVRAFDTNHGGYLPVSGSARLEVDFTDATIDVDFTDFDTDHDDMSWQGIQLTGGSFQDTQYSPTYQTIEGAFYGEEHQGAAGKFDRDNLRGVFGAVRN